jgi:peroxiredoxin Q/BCP
MLNIGDKAPDFASKDENGTPIKLSDYLGKKIVLYFYPKDNTSGCTAQACDLKDNYDFLQKNGYEVLGVSSDDEKSHRKFIEKYSLPFKLIADTSKEVHELYGTWQEKKMYGKTYMGTVRTTFLIDEQGIIADIITKVVTKTHASQILKG